MSRTAPRSPMFALDTALDLLGRGFWPIAIYPPGVTKRDGKISKGKEPIGRDWGTERWDEKRLRLPSGNTPRPELESVLGPAEVPPAHG